MKRNDEPLKTVWTVRKYEPMGTTIMANVKPRSLKMTSLSMGKKRREGPGLAAACEAWGLDVGEDSLGDGGGYV